jgi:hypothetical protein
LIPEGTTPQTIVLSQVSKASDLDTCPSFSQHVPFGKQIKRQISIDLSKIQSNFEPIYQNQNFETITGHNGKPSS